MQISCPQCATSYELDERLLPAQGAPVQCTRCSFVFTAAPPRRDENKTQIFGMAQVRPPAPAPSDSGSVIDGDDAREEPPPPSERTNIYGRTAPLPPGAIPTGTMPYGKRSPSKTQVFGAGTPAGAPDSGPHTTMMFGRAGPPSAPEAAPGGTKIFGAPGATRETSAPDSGPHTTMMFGRAGQPSAPEAAQGGTQKEGPAGTTHAATTPDSGPHTTMMFGRAGRPSAPEAEQGGTQNAGSAGATHAATTPDSGPHTTMMFGRAGQPSAPDAAPQDVSATEAAPRGTQIFGAATSAQTPSAPIPRGTQIFGSASSAPTAAAPIPHGTQVSGAASSAPTPSAPIPRGTQIFGTAGLRAPQTASSDSGPHTTMMFGRAGRPADPAPAAAPHPTQPYGAPHATQLYGAPAATPSTHVPSARTTQRFEVLGSPPPAPQPSPSPNALPQYDDAVADPEAENASIPFDARATIHEPMPVPFAHIRSGTQGAPARTATGESPTLVPGAGTVAAFANAQPASSADGDAPTWIPSAGRRATGTAPVAEPARPLEPFNPPALTAPDTDASLLIDDGTTALIESRNRRRNLVLGLLAVLVLGIGGYVGYDLWSNREKPPPPEAIGAAEHALTTLRRDDAKSLETAIAAHQALVTKYPDYLDARVNLLTALLFQYDDLRMQLDRSKERSDALSTKIARLQERKSPSDWQNRVNAMVDELTELKRQSDPLVDAATALDGRVNEAFQAVQTLVPAEPTPAQELLRVRAQALYFGVKGSDQAITLSERYRILGGKDGWGDIAFAEYALNTRVAPETLREAREALEAIKAQDNSYVRLYVLIGRLALGEKSLDAANTAFESALTLNPEHDAARRLLRQVEQQRSGK